METNALAGLPSSRAGCAAAVFEADAGEESVDGGDGLGALGRLLRAHIPICGVGAHRGILLGSFSGVKVIGPAFGRALERLLGRGY
jgi:hypothetical protein